MTAFKGLGTYGNAVGVVTPLDHHLANGATLVKSSTGVPRAGLFWGGTTTIVTGTAGMAYSVTAYGCATVRSATAGAVIGGNDGTLSVATTAAPGSNSRYDVVYHWHREYSLDGTDSNPVIGVIQGTAAASPTVPSLAAFPGAIALATILVPAGVTATSTGTTITQTAPFTAMSGGRLVFRNTTERDAFAATDGQLAYVTADGSGYESKTGVWTLITGDTGWIPLILTGSWIPFGGTAYASPCYRRVNGRVKYSGLMKNGSIGAGTTFANVPAGFRPGPNFQPMFACGGAAYAMVEVTTAGALKITAATSSTYIALDSIDYIAES